MSYEVTGSEEEGDSLIQGNPSAGELWRNNGETLSFDAVTSSSNPPHRQLS